MVQETPPQTLQRIMEKIVVKVAKYEVITALGTL